MKKIRGFTLVELLVSALLFCVIMASLLMTFQIISSNWQFDSDLVRLQQQVRLAAERMTREIRQSRLADINIPAQGESLTFAIGGETISYSLDADGNIQRSAGGNTLIMGNSINALHFTLSGNTVNVELTGTGITLNRNLSFNLTEKVALRN